MRCDRCKAVLAVGNGGFYCPNDCDRIPQLLTGSANDETTISDTVAADDGLVDTQGVTQPYHATFPCCDKEEREPFWLYNGDEAQHCVNCGRIFS